MDNVETMELHGMTLAMTERDGGWDMELRMGEGQHVAFCQPHDDAIDMKVREVSLPSPGSTVMVDGTAHVVKSRHFDEGGHVHIVDADTLQNVQWV